MSSSAPADQVSPSFRGRACDPRTGWPTPRTHWTASPDHEDPARRLTFYLGAPSPRWGEESPVPVFISARQLARYRRRGDDFPHMGCHWALDSGGFTELRDHGTWRMHPDEYGGMVTRFMDEAGAPPAWCAPRDWMCEPAIIHGGTVAGQRYAGTGLSVRVHQELTVENLLYLREQFYFVNWIPVLQGWQLDDYLAHAEMYAAAGVDLATEHRVGLGSVCRRASTAEIQAIVSTFHARGYRLHGFGVKVTGLRRIGHMLASADSMAWSMQARRQRIRLPNCAHAGPCSYCLTCALHWREDVLDTLREPQQMALDLVF
jgi:hypothetical protein